MKNSMITLTVLSTILLAGCASPRRQASEITTRESATSRAAAMSGGSEFAVVEFEKGSYALTSEGRATLQKVANITKNEGRDVNEIKVLAWADREYPADGSRANSRDVNLADDRASVIKTYLKDDLNADMDVDKHNMAQRPGSFSELVKTDDYKIKNNFENSGAAPTTANTDDLRTKVSKAIIVIKYE